ncbi:MAG: cation transporter [Spirochaetaceae bacterium]|nr:cation transporter [Spirochaetaceae bacterium]
MKKKFNCQIDCANCARKLEEKIKKIDRVEDVNINFMMKKMVLSIPDDCFDEVFKEVLAVAKRVEPDVVIS